MGRLDFLPEDSYADEEEYYDTLDFDELPTQEPALEIPAWREGLPSALSPPVPIEEDPLIIIGWNYPPVPYPPLTPSLPPTPEHELFFVEPNLPPPPQRVRNATIPPGIFSRREVPPEEISMIEPEPEDEEPGEEGEQAAVGRLSSMSLIAAVTASAGGK